MLIKLSELVEALQTIDPTIKHDSIEDLCLTGELPAKRNRFAKAGWWMIETSEPAFKQWLGLYFSTEEVASLAGTFQLNTTQMKLHIVA